MEFNTKYIQEPNARINRARYQDGSVALQVISEIGEPLATATVNLGAYGHKPAKGNVFIYGDYSEHVGVYVALRKAGVIGESIRTIPMGGFDAEAYECPLLIDDKLGLL